MTIFQLYSHKSWVSWKKINWDQKGFCDIFTPLFCILIKRVEENGKEICGEIWRLFEKKFEKVDEAMRGWQSINGPKWLAGLYKDMEWLIKYADLLVEDGEEVVMKAKDTMHHLTQSLIKIRNKFENDP